MRFCSGNASPPVAPPLNCTLGVMPASLAACMTSSSSASVAGGSVMPTWAASSLL